jgi:two-component system sensor histidine kinase UhpB
MSDSWPLPPEPRETLASVLERIERLTRENERLFTQLAHGEKRYRRLAKAVWRVQEEERRRLARELHDGIGQNLTALKNQLEMLAGREPRDSGRTAPLRDAIELTARALADTRELSRLLRPPVLDDLGLVAALSWLVRRLEERTAFHVDFRHQGVGEERLPPEVETLIFRVAQEGLNNALKHSQVEQAELALERRGERLSLRIADRGVGFDPAAQPSETIGGLRGMRDRVEVHGGRFEIRSAPGAGTSIQVDLVVDGGSRGDGE